MNTLNINKVCQNTDISTKIIKSNGDLFANYVLRNFHFCLKKGEFLCVLKHADVVLVYKKREKTNKENYGLVSILPDISRIYEKLMYQQLYDYFGSILSQKQCGFCKGHSVQHCLMVMLKKFKQSRDRRDEFGWMTPLRILVQKICFL